METPGSYNDWIGRVAIDANGDRIGEIKDIYYDDVTGRPEWVAVKTGLLGSRAIAPINGASICRHSESDAEDELQLSYTKDQIAEAPDVDDADDHIDADDERDLYTHYGFTHANTTGEGTYGKSYGKLRPDVDYPAARYDRQAKAWGDERRVEEHVEEVPVQAKVEIPVETSVRLRRYQTQRQRTETRQVEVPVTETEEHVEVADVDAEAGKPRNA